MNNNWDDEDDDDGNDGPEYLHDIHEFCNPNKQYQITITISSIGTSPIARADISWRAGALGLPGFLLNENSSSSIENIDVKPFATLLQLDFLLNSAELYKTHGLPPHNYTPGETMAAAHILGASLLDHIHSIDDRRIFE